MAEARGVAQQQETTVEIKELETGSGHEDEEESHPGELGAIIAISELIEVALHTILCIRQVYPIEIFERRAKLGIPVFQCIDPSISEYISEVVKAIGEEVAEDRIARVTISIHQSETPLEKFIFSFYCKDGGAGAPKADILPLHVVQRQARGMLIKLNSIDAQLLPLEDSDDLSFSVIMELRDENSFRISEDELKFDETGKDEIKNNDHERAPSPSMLKEPSLVHIIRTGRLSMYLHVQESEAKERRDPSSASNDGKEAELGANHLE